MSMEMNKANECTCPSGDGSLRWPCPKHPAVEQAGGDERVIGWSERILAAHPNSDPGFWTDALLVEHMAAEIADLRAALAQPSQSQYEASFEEWLANELEGEDGQPVPAAVCDIALARRAFNHWPKLEQPAKVGGVRFSAGVSSRLVVEAAQRLYEFESTPEKEAERIEQLQAFREQLDPLNLAPHAEAFNEAPDEAIRPEQAEAERPELEPHIPAQTIAEAAIEQLIKSGAKHYQEFHFDLHLDGHEGARPVVVTVAFSDGPSAHELRMKAEQERDAALARVARLERGKVYVEARQCDECQHGGINDSATGVAACHECDWTGPEPEEDRCPGCQRENCMAAACPQCGARYVLVASEEVAAPVAQAQHSVPDAELLSDIDKHLTDWLELHDCECENGHICGRDNVRATRDKVRKLLAAAPGKEGYTGWATQYPGRAAKLWGSREIAELNWWPEDGQQLFRVVEVERIAAPAQGDNDD
ncbi:TPA: hypothetical protein ACXJFQ_005106 [Pseudomonas aeruginosa]